MEMPCYHRDRQFFDAVLKVKEKLGVVRRIENEHAYKKPKVQHPALHDVRWLDCTFLAGPEKEEIKANRAMLASMNPVLSRILYGTGSISVDFSRPIEWSEFDSTAVRCVLSALVQHGTEEVEVPMEIVESAKALVDYLMETPKSLNLCFETPFKRKFQGELTLTEFEEWEVEGLQLSTV